MATQKRVFVGSIATETNTFSPLRTDLQDFKDSFYKGPGEHPPTPTLCSAVFPVAREVAQQNHWTLIEGTACWAEPGGVVNQHTWDFLRKQLLQELQAAMPVDIVLLGLHGAMVSQDCNDCEGELLEAIRALTAPGTLIGVTFDPHSHLTEKRTGNADVITVFKEFPHTDFVETAEDMVRLIQATSIKSITPCISTFDCKMIEVLPTSREPMRSFVDKIKSIEGTGNVLSISVIHGFMAGDVAELGCRIIVITNNTPDYGAQLARQLGMELYSFRGTTKPKLLTPIAALDSAQQTSDKRDTNTKTGPVVIADVWDNPGGGVAGDSTIILNEMLQRGITDAAFATLWDPIAVRTCISAGAGATLSLRFGGKMSANGGQPIDAEVVVRNTVRDATQNFCGSIVPIGDSVWIDVDGISVILNSVRSQVFDPSVFYNMGIDPTEKNLLIVKSTNHFYAAFSEIASTILYAEVDGPYPNNPLSTPYKNLTRPIWPRALNPHDESL
ncbi:microcystin LR degradation protein MlrC-like protein [Chromatiales bacterium (ex Bugula neritina AB1)]|nr:microcystin LR degradation protein MlrC-like protein [Chromatiales bacterium (ex Bugula neritina AB1)]